MEGGILRNTNGKITTKKDAQKWNIQQVYQGGVLCAIVIVLVYLNLINTHWQFFVPFLSIYAIFSIILIWKQRNSNTYATNLYLYLKYKFRNRNRKFS